MWWEGEEAERLRGGDGGCQGEDMYVLVLKKFAQSTPTASARENLAAAGT